MVAGERIIEAAVPGCARHVSRLMTDLCLDHTLPLCELSTGFIVAHHLGAHNLNCGWPYGLYSLAVG